MSYEFRRPEELRNKDGIWGKRFGILVKEFSFIAIGNVLSKQMYMYLPDCREEDFGLYLTQVRLWLHLWKYVLYQDAVILGQVVLTVHICYRKPN